MSDTLITGSPVCGTLTVKGSDGKLHPMVLSGDNVDSVPVYQGATAQAAGVTGTVPPATSAEKNSFLKGDGTWGALNEYPRIKKVAHANYNDVYNMYYPTPASANFIDLQTNQPTELMFASYRGIKISSSNGTQHGIYNRVSIAIGATPEDYAGDGLLATQGILSVPEYEGATASADGTDGLVPAATSAEKDKFLQGDGTWEPALVDVGGEVVQSQGVHPVINNVQYLSAEATLTFNVYDTQYDYDFDQPETLVVGCSSCSGFVSGTEQLITQDDATSRIVGTWGGPNIQLTASDTISFYGSLSVGGYDPILLVFVDAEQETTYGIYAPAITSVVLPVGATYTVQATLVTISGVTNSPEPIEDHPEVGTWTFSFVRDSAYAISSYVLWTSPNDVAAGEAVRLTGTMSDSTTVTHDVMLPAVVHINGAETINGVKTFNAGYFGNVEALTEDQNNPGEYPVDVSHATSFTLTLDDDAEFVFSGVPANRSACFSLKLDNGGDYTVTWPSSVHWCNDTEPELTSGGTDILTFITFDGGTNWYGTLSMTGITQ